MTKEKKYILTMWENMVLGHSEDKDDPKGYAEIMRFAFNETYGMFPEDMFMNC